MTRDGSGEVGEASGLPTAVLVHPDGSVEEMGPAEGSAGAIEGLPPGALERLLATYRAIQASQSDVAAVMRLTVRNVRSLLTADYCCIWRAGARGGRVVASEGHRVEPWAAEVAPEETGIGWRCIELGRPALASDYRAFADRAVYPVSSYLAGSEGISTVLCLPLRDGGGADSVLYVGRRRATSYRGSDIALASALAGQAALALQNGRLRRELDEQHALLEHSVRVAEQLSRAADAAGVDGVCRALAREIGRRVEFAAGSGGEPDTGARTVAVVAGREHHGDLHIYGRPLTTRDAVSVEQATGLIARDIARTQAQSLLRVRTGAQLLRSLLDGASPDQPHIAERARRIGFDLLRPVTVVALAHEGIDPAQLQLLAADAGGLSDESVLSTEEVGGSVLAVAMPEGWTPDRMVGELVARAGVLRAGVLRAGVSTGRRDLVAARDEASACLALAREAPSRRAVFAEALGPLWFLLGVTDAVVEMRGFVQAQLGAVHAAQTRTGTALLDSLDAYLSTGRRTAAAAGVLGVHHNTLKYRLSRLRQHVGLDLDGASAFELWLALRARDVLRYLGYSCFEAD